MPSDRNVEVSLEDALQAVVDAPSAVESPLTTGDSLPPSLPFRIFGLVPKCRRGSRPCRQKVKPLDGNASTAGRYFIPPTPGALCITLRNNRAGVLQFALQLFPKEKRKGEYLFCCFSFPALFNTTFLRVPRQVYFIVQCNATKEAEARAVKRGDGCLCD